MEACLRGAGGDAMKSKLGACVASAMLAMNMAFGEFTASAATVSSSQYIQVPYDMSSAGVFTLGDPDQIAWAIEFTSVNPGTGTIQFFSSSSIPKILFASDTFAVPSSPGVVTIIQIINLSPSLTDPFGLVAIKASDGAVFDVTILAFAFGIQSLGAFSGSPTFESHDFETIEITAPPAETPLPAALPLFAGGLGVIGLLGWRRKRKQVA
jgi:hypothetical protein